MLLNLLPGMHEVQLLAEFEHVKQGLLQLKQVLPDKYVPFKHAEHTTGLSASQEVHPGAH